MKAFVKTEYGGPEVLQLQEIEKPVPKKGQLLVKVMANSANPADWHVLRGKPSLVRLSFGWFRPKDKVLGSDFAGVVEAVGDNVGSFKVGDRVFGETLGKGAFAEYVCAPATACASIPAGMNFPEMAGAPIAGLTAWQALITHGRLREGESVLINGSSGGVGHLTIQVAKVYGAQVTAVCSGRNADFVKALGADQVIAYDQENIHQHGKQYDLVIDNHGNLTYSDFKRMGRRGVMVGFTTTRHMTSVLLKSAFDTFPLTQFTAEANTKDLEAVANLLRSGEVSIHLHKTYPYSQIPEAIRYIEDMHTQGKVVMVWDDTPSADKAESESKTVSNPDRTP